MEWPWSDVRKAIDASDGNFTAFLKRLPRTEIERLIYSTSHQCNVFGFYKGSNGDRAREIYDDVLRRAVSCHHDTDLDADCMDCIAEVETAARKLS